MTSLSHGHIAQEVAKDLSLFSMWWHGGIRLPAKVASLSSQRRTSTSHIGKWDSQSNRYIIGIPHVALPSKLLIHSLSPSCPDQLSPDDATCCFTAHCVTGSLSAR